MLSQPIRCELPNSGPNLIVFTDFRAAQFSCVPFHHGFTAAGLQKQAIPAQPDSLRCRGIHQVKGRGLQNALNDAISCGDRIP